MEYELIKYLLIGKIIFDILTFFILSYKAYKIRKFINKADKIESLNTLLENKHCIVCGSSRNEIIETEFGDNKETMLPTEPPKDMNTFWKNFNKAMDTDHAISLEKGKAASDNIAKSVGYRPERG